MDLIEDITVIVQGPVTELSLKSAAHYSEDYHVIVSCWDDGDERLLEELSALANKRNNIKLIIKPLPSRENLVGCDAKSTFFWAVSGMNNALQIVETDYVVRTRSDEYFETLEPLINTCAGIPANNDKFVCGNIFVKKWPKHEITAQLDILSPNHIGDHIYIAKTHFLKNAFTNLFEIYTGLMELQDWACQGPFCAEQILAHAYYFSKEVPSHEWIYFDTFTQHFHVINIDKLGDYVVRWGHRDQIWFSDFINPHGVSEMSDMLQE